MRDWERWLTGHHESSPGVWLMIAKKGSAVTSVSYAEALEAALCHGWIDGQKQVHDDSEAWLQKFTPRGARSIWSKINREKAHLDADVLEFRNVDQESSCRDQFPPDRCGDE